MKKILYIIFLLVVWHCSIPLNKKDYGPYYIYDSNHIFQEYRNDNDSSAYLIFATNKPIRKYCDSLLIAEDYKYYQLAHFLKYNNYMDISFKKQKSYLDSITFFDNKWIENEEKLDSFWKSIDCWKCSGIYDTVKIYLINPVENTDSLLFLQVHRLFHQTQ